MTLNKLQVTTDELNNISKFWDVFNLSNYGFSIVILPSTVHLPPNRPLVVYAFYDDGKSAENLSYRRIFFDETGLIISMDEFESRYFKNHERRFLSEYKKMLKQR